MLTTIGRDGRQLAWEEYGDPAGTPVVFLHGTPGGRLGAASRDGFFAALNLRVLATDRAGYGGTDASPGRTVLTQAADIIDVLDAASIDRAFVVGGSGGGPHALAAGVFAADRVHAVGVLVGAVRLEPEQVKGQVAFNRTLFAALDDEEELRNLLEQGRRTVLDEGIESLLTDAPASDRAARAAMADVLAVTYADALAPGVEGMFDDYQALWRRPWGFEPEDVKVPALWGHGTSDLYVPYDAARAVAQRLPLGELITWEGSGHAVTDEQMTEAFTRLLELR